MADQHGSNGGGRNERRGARTSPHTLRSQLRVRNRPRVRIRPSARVRPERSCASDGGSARASRRGPLAPILHGLFFVAAATQTAIVPLLPRLSHAYGLTPPASALLLAAPGLATLAISMPAGVFADQFGARRVTVFATALMCVAAVAQAVPSYLVLVVGRLAFGLAFGTVWTTGVAWMSSSHDESATPHLGAVATSAAVGMVAGPAIGGVLADHLGLSAPFVFVAVFAAVLAIVLWRQPGGRRSAAATRDIHALRDFVRVAPRRPGVLAGAIALAIAGAVGGVAQLLVPLGLHRAGFTASATGVAFSAAAGVYIVVSVVVVWVGRRATTLRWTAVAALALALSLLPAAIDAHAGALVGVLLLSTAPRAVVSTITYPLATESAAGAALGDGVVIGLLNGSWAMGQVVAPLLAGAVAQLVGTRPAYLVAVVPGAVAALWLLARRDATGVALQPKAPADHSPPATSEHELAVASG